MLIECTGCGKSLPSEDFHDALKWRRCKVCVRVHMRDKYHACADTKRGIKVRNRTKLLERYGLTWESFRALLESQDYRCAICGNPLKDEVSAPREQQACVDHCHTSGNVRGILCTNCNLALGYLKDNPALARAAATYLERSTRG